MRRIYANNKFSQVTNGGAFAYSPTYFFVSAGISTSAAYGIALGGTGIAFAGTCLSWFLMPHFGQQYMFGPSLLVAPIFNEQGTVEFYVPQAEDGSDDEWTSLFTGKRYKPGKWYNETHDFLSLPLLLRPNSLLIRNTAITRPEHDISEGLEALYGHVTKDVSVEVFDSRGNVLGSLATTQEGGKVSVLGDGIKVKQSFVGDGKGIF